MESRIAALEEEIAGVKATLSSMEQGQATLIAMMERTLGKSIAKGDEELVVLDGSAGKGSGEGGSKQRTEGSKKQTEGSMSNQLNDETLLEFRRSVKKVELPMFDGEDPAGWISRAEVYFRVQGTSPEVKVSLAQLCMEVATIHFFNSLICENEGLDWEGLKEALLGRYGGHGDGDVYEQLTDLKQKGTVDEYITDFEYLIAQILRLPDKQFLGYFLHGLKMEIRGKVRSLIAAGEMSRAKLLQVTRAVEREVKGSNGLDSHRGPRMGPN
ncbi:hypothetical protein QL285_030786 [Trifolium repens]|nr:hypothetical protein QL285_030786 [Trifolium repens]